MTLQAIYASSDQAAAESQLHWWCTLAKTVRQHWEGILACFLGGEHASEEEAFNKDLLRLFLR